MTKFKLTDEHHANRHLQQLIYRCDKNDTKQI